MRQFRGPSAAYNRGRVRGCWSSSIRRGELPALHLGGPRTALRVDDRQLNSSVYSNLGDIASGATDTELRRRFIFAKTVRFFRQDAP